MSNQRSKPSQQTRTNWLIDATLFGSAILAAISGIYFLFLPAGGYRGGRNPMYGVTFLFDRHTWDDLHTWTGVLMIAAALIHFVIHWRWVVSIAKRIVKQMRGQCPGLNAKGLFNVILDALVALSFLLTAISGLYFLFVPEAAQVRGAQATLLFDRTTWDLIHTWAGVILIGAAVVHFAIHWGWVTKVTRSILVSLLPDRGRLLEAEKASV